MTVHGDVPPRLRKALAHPIEERRPWSKTLASSLIATYLWVAYYDRIAPSTAIVGGLWPAIIGAAIGGGLGCALLFVPAALRGVRTRQPLMVVATSSFGVTGSALVPGLLMGLVQLVWFAVAVHYAVDFNLRGLVSVGLIEPESIRSASWGGVVYRSPVYAVSVLVWGVAAALVATRFIRWIAALMIVFPIFCALVLGGAMLWAIPGLPAFQPLRVLPHSGEPIETGWASWLATAGMIQLVFGFSATVGAQSVNWGATLRSTRDVRLGGAIGVGLASTILATLAVLTVAGFVGRSSLIDAIDDDPAGELTAGLDDKPPPPSDVPVLPTRPDPNWYTVGTVLEDGIGGIPGGAGLMVLGLASMASAVYASYAFSNRFEAIQSRPRRWAWGVIGAAIAFPLQLTGLAANVPLVIDLTGGVVSPMLGVIASGLVRDRGRWPGPRPGTVPAGLISWAVGSAVGLIPVVARAIDQETLLGGLPATPIAFTVAFGGNWILNNGPHPAR